MLPSIDRSEWSESLGAEGGTGKYFNDYCQWKNIPEFEEFVYKSTAAEIVGTLMQSEVCVNRSDLNISYRFATHFKNIL